VKHSFSLKTTFHPWLRVTASEMFFPPAHSIHEHLSWNY
jgi:hypothetical protein